MSWLKESKHSEQVIWVVLVFAMLFSVSDLIFQLLEYKFDLSNAYFFLSSIFTGSAFLRGYNKYEDTKRQAYEQQITREMSN